MLSYTHPFYKVGIYPGVRVDCEIIGSGDAEGLVFVLDVPLSAIVDTILLPGNLYEVWKTERETRDQQRKSDKAVNEFMRANILQEQGKYEEAIRSFQQCVETDKGNSLVPYALYETAKCYRILKRNADALAVFQRLADQCPDSEPAKSSRTEMETLKRAIEASPDPQMR